MALAHMEFSLHTVYPRPSKYRLFTWISEYYSSRWARPSGVLINQLREGREGRGPDL